MDKTINFTHQLVFAPKRKITMTTRHNPALYEEPRNQSVKIVPPIPRESLLSWLESTNRFHSSEIDEFQDHKISEDLDDILETEIYSLENEEEQID
jgi:Protein of unknown function (DUF3134)